MSRLVRRLAPPLLLVLIGCTTLSSGLSAAPPADPGPPAVAWVRLFGGEFEDEGTAVGALSDGSVLVAGSSFVGRREDGIVRGDRDIFVARLTAGGEPLWTRVIGARGQELWPDLAVGPEDAVYLVAAIEWRRPRQGYALQLMRLDLDGRVAWRRTLPGTGPIYAPRIAPASDGSIYVAATSTARRRGDDPTNILLARLTAEGELIWKRRVPGYKQTYLGGLAVGRDGSAYLTGITGFQSDGSRGLLAAAPEAGTEAFLPDAGDFPRRGMVLARYSPDGERLWNRVVEVPGFAFGADVTVDERDRVFVTGTAYRLHGRDTGRDPELLVARYTTSGRLVWARFLGGADSEGGLAVLAHGDGVYVAGLTDSPLLADRITSGDNDVVLAKYDDDGRRLWVALFGAEDNERATGLAVGPGGELYVAGSTESLRFLDQPSNGMNDLFLLSLREVGG